MINNIVEICEMIDIMDEFINSNNKQIYVGGCVGTNICDIVFEAVSSRYMPHEVLVVEGCQDIVEMLYKYTYNKTRHIFYATMFQTFIVNGINGYDEFKPALLQPKPEYHIIINESILKQFKCIIVRDAHLIPQEYITALSITFNGQVMCVFDPFDINGEKYTNVPTIVDSLSKVSPIIALARSVYDIDSRAIDNKVQCNVSEKSMPKRSIGKIDNNQYISNDDMLIETVRMRQLDSKFRKHHKMIVKGDYVYQCYGEHGNLITVNKDSMFTVQTSSENPMIKLKLHYSPDTFMNDVSYMNDPPRHMIPVKPANIISVNEASKHKFVNSVLVLTHDSIDKPIKYSMLKNSMNLTVVHV